LPCDVIGKTEPECITRSSRHEISIDFAPEEITLLYGSNGAGKSTVLRILRAALADDAGDLLSEPYKSLKLTFAGGLSYAVNGIEGKWEEHAGKRLTASGVLRSEQASPSNPQFRRFAAERFGPNAESMMQQASEDSSIMHMFFRWLERFPRTEHGRDSRRILPRPTQLLTSARTLYGGAAQRDSSGSETLDVEVQRKRDELDFLRNMQRLRARGGGTNPVIPGAPSSLDKVAAEMRERLNSAVSAAQERARALDSTFGRRVIERVSAPNPISMAQLRELRANAESLHARLARCGLLSAEMSLPPEDAVSDARMDSFMQLYLADMHTKALTLLPLLKRIEALKEIVDSHFADKQILITAGKGVSVQLLQGAGGRDLGLDKLSSGEQQILLLFYSLLFRSERGSIFMIDEPEISLNVLWQEKFIDNLLKVAKVVPMQFVLATHSPQIVGNHQHLLRQVGRS
jgi:predicted ATPase